MILKYAIQFIAIVYMAVLTVASIYEREKTKDPLFITLIFGFLLTICAIII